MIKQLKLMKDRYVDRYGYLLETDWKGDPATGDALWRTAILDIVNNTCTTDACYDDGKVFRHPKYKLDRVRGAENTCSRDQVIMDQVARIITHSRLPYVDVKISDKFYQTPDMWLWMRAIRGSRSSAWLFHAWNYFSLPKLLERNERLWKKGEDVYFAKGMKGRYPFYAFHLMSWMTYVLPDSKMKRKVNKLCLEWVNYLDPDNYLLVMLHGGRDSNMLYHINNYLPLGDFRWQRIEDRMPSGVGFELYKGPYPIDKDILKAIYERDSPDCVH